jgi:hypothetical protein
VSEVTTRRRSLTLVAPRDQHRRTRRYYGGGIGESAAVGVRYGYQRIHVLPRARGLEMYGFKVGLSSKEGGLCSSLDQDSAQPCFARRVKTKCGSFSAPYMADSSDIAPISSTHGNQGAASNAMFGTPMSICKVLLSHTRGFFDRNPYLTT